MASPHSVLDLKALDAELAPKRARVFFGFDRRPWGSGVVTGQWFDARLYCSGSVLLDRPPVRPEACDLSPAHCVIATVLIPT